MVTEGERTSAWLSMGNDSGKVEVPLSKDLGLFGPVKTTALVLP